MTAHRAVGKFATFAGVTGLFGSWLWLSQGSTTMALTLVAGAAVCFGSRAALDGLVDREDLRRAAARVRRPAPDPRQVPRPSRRQVAAAGFCVLLVVGTAVAPFAGLVIDDRAGSDGTVAAAEGDQEWSSSASDTIVGGSSVVDGVVYWGAADNTVRASYADNGTTKWSYTAGNDIPAAPIYHNGTVYVEASNDQIYALDANTGNVDWSTATDGPAGIAIDDGNLYTVNSSADIVAYDLSDGSSNWTYLTSESSAKDRPVAEDGVVYAQTSEGSLYAVNSDGSLKWSSGTSGFNHGPPSIGENHVYSADGSTLKAFDIETGSQEWSFSTGGNIKNAPTPYEGTVYIGSKDDNVYAVDANDGIEQWSYTTGNFVFPSPTVADGTVYAHSDDGTLYALDEDSGTEQWTFSQGGRGDPIVADGTVYFGAGSTFYAVDTGDATTSQDRRVEVGIHGVVGSGYFGESVSGTVTDDDGAAVEGATVSVTNTSTGSEVASLTTDSAGAWDTSVDAGEYNVVADADNYSSKTKTVDVPEGGLSVDFSLLDAPGSLTVLGSDGTEITDRETRVELYKATNDTISEDARYWLDETDASPLATGSDSSVSLEAAAAAGRDGKYVVAFRSEDASDPTYRDVAVPLDDVTKDWTLHLTGTDDVQMRVAVRDRTGNWSSERVTIRADLLPSETTGDRAALGSENLGTLYLNDSERYDFYAERDDGAERYLGELNAVQEISDEVVIIDILEPADEWDDLNMTNKTNQTSTHAEAWDNESQIHYPPIASVTANNTSPVAGDIIEFDASDARAMGEASIDTWDWTLPDGSSASGWTATFDTSGYSGETITATVTVTDTEGVQDTQELSLYVAGTAEEAAGPPLADAQVVSDQPVVDEPVVLESISSAASGASIESVEWDLTDNGDFSDAAGESVEFVPEESGLQSVGIKVTDSNGVTDAFYVNFFVASDAEQGLASAGGGGGAGPLGGSGDGLGGGEQVVLGIGGIAGYAAWRRAGGPGIVAGARRVAPAAGRVASRAASAAGSLASTAGRSIRRLLGRLGR